MKQLSIFADPKYPNPDDNKDDGDNDDDDNDDDDDDDDDNGCGGKKHCDPCKGKGKQQQFTFSQILH